MDDLNGEHREEEQPATRRQSKKTVFYGDFARPREVASAIDQSHGEWGPYAGASDEKRLDMKRRLHETAENGFGKDNPHPLKITIELKKENGPESEIKARVIHNTASDYDAVGKEKEGQVDRQGDPVNQPPTPYPYSSDDEDEDEDEDEHDEDDEDKDEDEDDLITKESNAKIAKYNANKDKRKLDDRGRLKEASLQWDKEPGRDIGYKSKLSHGNGQVRFFNYHESPHMHLPDQELEEKSTFQTGLDGITSLVIEQCLYAIKNSRPKVSLKKAKGWINELIEENIGIYQRDYPELNNENILLECKRRLALMVDKFQGLFIDRDRLAEEKAAWSKAKSEARDNSNILWEEYSEAYYENLAPSSSLMTGQQGGHGSRGKEVLNHHHKATLPAISLMQRAVDKLLQELHPTRPKRQRVKRTYGPGNGAGNIQAGLINSPYAGQQDTSWTMHRDGPMAEVINGQGSRTKGPGIGDEDPWKRFNRGHMHIKELLEEVEARGHVLGAREQDEMQADSVGQSSSMSLDDRPIRGGSA